MYDCKYEQWGYNNVARYKCKFSGISEKLKEKAKKLGMNIKVIRKLSCCHSYIL